MISSHVPSIISSLASKVNDGVSLLFILEDKTGYSSNNYASSNTTDKVYLLSYVEANTLSSSNRKILTSDYSRAMGAYMSTSSSTYGNGRWWLRSPYAYDEDKARDVEYDGSLSSNIYNVAGSQNGIAPALKIKK